VYRARNGNWYAVFLVTPAGVILSDPINPDVDGRYPCMPADMWDRNDNGVIDLDEISMPTTAWPGICGRGQLVCADGSEPRRAHPTAELMADIRRPDIFYSDRMRIDLDGKTVELIHPGLNHSDDAT
jgi:hypothetical protein